MMLVLKDANLQTAAHAGVKAAPGTIGHDVNVKTILTRHRLTARSLDSRSLRKARSRFARDDRVWLIALQHDRYIFCGLSNLDDDIAGDKFCDLCRGNHLTIYFYRPLFS